MDYIAYLQQAAGWASSAYFKDDFLGTNLSTYQWLAPSNTNATVAIVDDSAAGGFGSLKLIAAGTGAWHSYVTQHPIAAMDAAPTTDFWQICYRVRCSAYATTANTSYVSFGFENPIGPEILIKATGPGGANPTFFVSINGTIGPVHDTGVTPSAVAYQTIVATCIGTTLIVTIDGTAVYTNNSFTSPTGATPTIRAFGVGTTDAVLYVDSVSYNIGRPR